MFTKLNQTKRNLLFLVSYISVHVSVFNSPALQLQPFKCAFGFAVTKQPDSFQFQ